MNATRIALAAAPVPLVGLLAAALVHTPETTESSCAIVLESDVCTWVTMQGTTPVEMGATVPLSLVEAVPGEAEMVWPPQELASVPMPAAARAALGVDHLGINWEANGHPPTTFLTQHFDFHFYSITEAEVRDIDCADPAKPTALPATYALPDLEIPGMGTLVGLCVPSMGMHAMPGHEVHDTEPFQASMLLGYYGGRAIFLEPMISRDLLLQRSDFTLDMPEAPAGTRDDRYPTRFRAEYDGAADAYRFVFSGFGNARQHAGR